MRKSVQTFLNRDWNIMPKWDSDMLRNGIRTCCDLGFRHAEMGFKHSEMRFGHADMGFQHAAMRFGHVAKWNSVDDWFTVHCDRLPMHWVKSQFSNVQIPIEHVLNPIRQRSNPNSTTSQSQIGMSKSYFSNVRIPIQQRSNPNSTTSKS